MEILRAEGLVKYYGSGENLVKAVDHISFSVQRGEFVAVVGTSGSGKTTLLNLIGGLDYADEGNVIVDGQDITGMKDEELTIFRRRKIGFIFQNYNLVSVLNTEKNITLPIRLDGNKVDENYITSIVSSLGIAEKRKAFPNQLSGGQQQRVAIARALASKPALILADEPTGNLDSRSGAAVIGAFREAKEKLDATIFMVTHDSFSASLCDRVLLMRDGQVQKELKRQGSRREFMDILLDELKQLNERM